MRESTWTQGQVDDVLGYIIFADRLKWVCFALMFPIGLIFLYKTVVYFRRYKQEKKLLAPEECEYPIEHFVEVI